MIRIDFLPFSILCTYVLTVFCSLDCLLKVGVQIDLCKCFWPDFLSPKSQAKIWSMTSLKLFQSKVLSAILKHKLKLHSHTGGYMHISIYWYVRTTLAQNSHSYHLNTSEQLWHSTAIATISDMSEQLWHGTAIAIISDTSTQLWRGTAIASVSDTPSQLWHGTAIAAVSIHLHNFDTEKP